MRQEDDSHVISQWAMRAKALEIELQQARRAQGQRRGPRSTKEWLSDTTLAWKEEEDTWLVTYLDMMTLLLVLMLVMLAFAGQQSRTSVQGEARTGPITASLPTEFSNHADKTAALSNEKVEIQSMLPAHEPTTTTSGLSVKALGLDELGDKIDVLLTDQSLSFRINSEILFSSGQADLSVEGMAVLRTLSHVLIQYNYPLVVAGHTDAVPIRSIRYPSNWELSGARAGSVVRYFEANGVAKDRLRAVGYADTRPIADNASADGRASNRRVELVMEIPSELPAH